MAAMDEAPDRDEDLMDRYARGEACAFEILYRRHEMRVWRYVLRHVGNRAAADDLAQEVWFAVARDAPRYQPTARFTTWLFTIAHHRIIDAARTRRTLVPLDGEALTGDPAGGPAAGAESREKAAALLAAVGALPGDQRDAFLLHIEADLPVEQVAAVVGCSFETAKSRLRYARTRLRQALQEYA